LLAGERDDIREIEKWRRFHRTRGEVDDANLAALLDDEEPAGVAGRRGHEDRRIKSADHSDCIEGRQRLSVERRKSGGGGEPAGWAGAETADNSRNHEIDCKEMPLK
jgi:hypothetical protein